MALSEDQRAMLQLLVERGQSYGDIASLLGLEVGEVRERARGALREIAGEDPDREVALTDYLLGQADPIGRADAARHLQSDPEANALASKLETQLRLLAPGAELPALPAVQGGRGPAKKPTGDTAPEPQRDASSAGAISTRQRRLIAALLAGLAVVAVIALLVGGAFDSGGGGSDQAGDGGGSSASGSGSKTAAASKLTKAILAPEGGSSGRGVAFFFRQSKKKAPEIQVTAVGLDPLPKGSAYYVWMFSSEKLALPIGGFIVDQKGRGGARIPIPYQAAALVANGTLKEIDVTLTPNSDYQAAVAAAAKKKSFPPLTGTSVMRGKITGPLVGASSRLSKSSGGKGQG